MHSNEDLKQYCALCAKPSDYRSWAKNHQGRNASSLISPNNWIRHLKAYAGLKVALKVFARVTIYRQIGDRPVTKLTSVTDNLAFDLRLVRVFIDLYKLVTLPEKRKVTVCDLNRVAVI